MTEEFGVVLCEGKVKNGRRLKELSDRHEVELAHLWEENADFRRYVVEELAKLNANFVAEMVK